MEEVESFIVSAAGTRNFVYASKQALIKIDPSGDVAVECR